MNRDTPGNKGPTISWGDTRAGVAERGLRVG
jgi:hypothetical protein